MIDFRRKPVATQRRCAHWFEDIVIEVDNGSAVVADEMVMALMVENLVSPHPTAEVSFGNDAQISECFQGPVERGAIHCR